MRVSEELQRRDGLLNDLEALFRAQPMTWIPWTRLAEIAGACAWRTRCSELRTKRAMVIEWNRNVRTSAYRFLPHQPLGPDASTIRSGDGWLFDVHPRG